MSIIAARAWFHSKTGAKDWISNQIFPSIRNHFKEVLELTKHNDPREDLENSGSRVLILFDKDQTLLNYAITSMKEYSTLVEVLHEKPPYDESITTQLEEHFKQC